MTRKLHIGGVTHNEGWELLNAQPGQHVDHVCNAADLSRFPDTTFDVIYASHVLEHFDFVGELLSVVREWNRVLVAGGRLLISVPDMAILAKLYGAQDMTPDDRFCIMQMIFGGHIDAYDYHKVGLNQELLTVVLQEGGFVHIQRVDAFNIFSDTSSATFKDIPVSLNMIAEKPQKS